MNNPNGALWLNNRKPSRYAAIRLFCLPYAGGGAHIFQTWLDQFPHVVDVLPVQLPGHSGRRREACFIKMSSLVQAAIEALLPYFDYPFALFGHSMGALIAFEMTRLLQSSGSRQPVQLFVSGSRAPQFLPLERGRHNLTDAAFIAEIRRLNGILPAVFENSEVLSVCLPAIRADFELVETYCCQPGSPLVHPIRAFGGLQDSSVELEHLLAWQECTQARFLLSMFPGDHFFIHSARDELVETIYRDLTEAIQFPI